MKKTMFAGAVALALAATAAIAPLTVSAADGSATGTTTAEFSVVAGGGTTTPGGDNGTGTNADLWLVKAPDMHFSDGKVADIISGTDLTYVDGTVTNKTNDSAENADGALQVTDNRGTGAGWKLSANINQPTNGTTQLTGALDLVLKDVTSPNTATNAPVAASLTTDGNDVLVWNAAVGQGQGNNTASVDAATKFHIDANPSVTNGLYDATVTWTLAGTPDAN